MDKNISRIRAGLKQLAFQPPEVISGIAVSGSFDETSCTISVNPSGSSTVIEGVTLNAVANQDKGFLLIPKDGSHVIIGSVDGPGEWTLLRSSEVSKAIFTIDNLRYEISDSKVSISKGDLVFDVGPEVFKMNTASESLYQLLSDLIAEIQNITVTTSSGPSSVPVNAPMFLALSTRLNNLLNA